MVTTVRLNTKTGKKNVCVDILSHLLHRPSYSNDENLLSGPDITDKMFEVSMLNSSNIFSKTVAQYDHLITDNQCTKEELDLSGYDLVTEKTKDKELLKQKKNYKVANPLKLSIVSTF